MNEEIEEDGAFEIPEEPDRDCPFCKEQSILSEVSSCKFWRYSCKCGLISRLFDSKEDAREWFNTRGGKLLKKYRRIKIEVGPKVNVISGVKLVDGKIDRTPESMGMPVSPQAEIDELNKDADEVEKTQSGAKVSMASGTDNKKKPF